MNFTWESLIGLRQRYINPHHKSYHPHSIDDAWMDFTLWFKEIILWLTGLKRDPELLTQESAALKILEQYVPKEADLAKPLVTWINHSSFFIGYKELRFLTDPIWSSRCTPLSGFGPKRKHPAGIELGNLPSFDYVLISHNHFDHLDLPTIRRLIKERPNLTYFVPEGCAPWMRRCGITKIVELSWWQSVTIEERGVSIRLTAVPAQHFSGRGLFDINASLWAGWVVEFFEKGWRTKVFYYVGDTGYNPIDFREIGRKFGPVDLSLVPIGAYLPRQIMSTIHANPYESLLIHRDVQSRLSIGCHYHTFALAQEHISQPPYDLLQAMEMQNFPKEQFLLTPAGHWINW